MKIALFYIFALAALFFGFLTITRRNPVNSAISLLGAFVSISALYLLLNAQFIAIVQIIIYAGAILVLILFTIMLLRLREAGKGFFDITSGKQRAAAVILAFILIVEFIYALLRSVGVIGKVSDEIAETQSLGPTQALSKKLFTVYIYPFEAASILLLLGVIGAYILTRRPAKPEGEADSTKQGE